MNTKACLILGISLSSTVLAGCIDATAMAPARLTASAANQIAEVAAGSFGQGLTLGARNGKIIVARLRARTIDTEGCQAIGDLEQALTRVTRTVRPSAAVQATDGNHDALVAGFYQGYIGAVKEGVLEARQDCRATRHTRGNFAGDLAGSLLCNIASVNIDLVQAIAIAPLYADWAGGAADTIAECHTSATATLQSCSGANVDLAQILSLSIEQSCADPALVTAGI